MTRSPSARQPLLLLAGVAAAALYVSILQIAAEMTPGYSRVTILTFTLWMAIASVVLARAEGRAEGRATAGVRPA